jgi:hypothetical protein
MTNPLRCPAPNPEVAIPVRVYYNLKQHNWSIQDRRTGRVIDHLALLTIRNAKFVVRPAGHAKVNMTGVKNVHSFVVGEWDGTNYVPEWDSSTHKRVRYNPFQMRHFIVVDTAQRAFKADEVVMYSDRAVYAKGLDTA